LGNALLPINIAVALLLLVINFMPDITALRVILGLPLILFFPGYALILTLFPKKDALDGIERMTLSFALSFVLVALIGLLLNYTPWGIRLTPVLYSQAGFILLMSLLAFWRQSRLPKAERYSVEGQVGFSREESKAGRVLSIVLAISILAALGVLIYTIASPRVGERFTEFYILGRARQATDYPRDFALSQGKVISVTYSQDQAVAASNGRVTMGIVNQEQEETVYEVKLTINGEPAAIYSGAGTVDILGPITLQQGQKWEEEIGFAPAQASEKQRVDFILLVGGQPYFEDPLHLWINATSAQ
jgi:uncharacterized membrane protein